MPSVTGDERLNDQPVRSVVQLQKTVLFDKSVETHFDDGVVNPHFYNCFTYSMLPQDRPRGKMTVGITSPRHGDGKTLVASNLAVSLALSTDSEVLLLDLNIQRPKIDQVFGTPRKPGLMEALSGPTIHVIPTKIPNLSVLPLGDFAANALQGIRLASSETSKGQRPASAALRLERLPEFRSVVYSLEDRFDVLIVDLPSLNESLIPSLFMKQLDGVIVVVNAGRTKREEIDALMAHVESQQILGFVFNRTPAGGLA